jgi:hypothetical protein
MVSPATSAALLLCVGAAGTLALAKPPGCRKLWERCAGADGQPSVEWGVGCCGGHPQADVDCLPHPDAATDGSKWGRFCQSPSGGGGQQGEPSATSEGEGSHADAAELDGGGGSNSLSKGNQTFDVREREPLLPGVYTADASAHVFNGTLYVYCSTDRPDENREDPNEMHFLMTVRLAPAGSHAWRRRVSPAPFAPPALTVGLAPCPPSPSPSPSPYPTPPLRAVCSGTPSCHSTATSPR